MIALEQNIKVAFRILHNKFEEYDQKILIAGGAVRDLLLDNQPSDIDFATTATPAEVKVILGDEWNIIDTGLEHGTLTIHDKGLGSFEVTSLRRDVSCDGRHAEIEYTQSFREDSNRRDFTINAMFMDIDDKIYDYHSGQSDLEKGIVRFVGDADTRIKEDALRMIRFFRMICKFKRVVMDDTSPCFNAIVANRALVKNISVERVWQEFKKVCKNNPENVSLFLIYMEHSGLADQLNFPIFKMLSIYINEEFIREYPELVMAVQFKDEQQALSFIEKYKLSVKEKNRIIFFVKNLNTLTVEKCEDLINNGVPRQEISALLSMNDNIINLDDISFTEFPVRGQDLLDRGFTQGEEVGKQLCKLHIQWKASRYKLTKEELLENEL